eukprot:maker-scaffold_40-snap-gene-2.70-mRNA-1 protein AED:0.47 eAED:0.47 QI:0/0/0/1/1/1/2/0/700
MIFHHYIGTLKWLGSSEELFCILLSRTVKLILRHVGPTNSAKTYNALKAISVAKSGVYLGPLRILAAEVRDTLHSRGSPCSLVTGQEEDIEPFMEDKQNLISSTIEMLDMNEVYDVGIIDEFQLVSDPKRGWAWSQACTFQCLFIVKAHELHICGDERIVPVVYAMSNDLGEEADLEIKRYSRLTELVSEKNSFHFPSTIHNSRQRKQNAPFRRGDCVVAFSRKKLFELKKVIESEFNTPTAIIYGNLPPESRKKQVNLFNNGKSPVLVATDAIGLGVNLDIRRVIFSSLVKFDGTKNRKLNVAEIKQISGRAGRYNPNSTNDAGLVNAFSRKDLSSVSKALKKNPPRISSVQVFPPTSLITSMMRARFQERLEDPVELENWRSYVLHLTMNLLLPQRKPKSWNNQNQQDIIQKLKVVVETGAKYKLLHDTPEHQQIVSNFLTPGHPPDYILLEARNVFSPKLEFFFESVRSVYYSTFQELCSKTFKKTSEITYLTSEMEKDFVIFQNLEGKFLTPSYLRLLSHAPINVRSAAVLKEVDYYATIFAEESSPLDILSDLNIELRNFFAELFEESAVKNLVVETLTEVSDSVEPSADFKDEAPIYVDQSLRRPKHQEQLSTLEDVIAVLEFKIWISRRLLMEPDTISILESERERCVKMLNRGLTRISFFNLASRNRRTEKQNIRKRVRGHKNRHGKKQPLQ